MSNYKSQEEIVEKLKEEGLNEHTIKRLATLGSKIKSLSSAIVVFNPKGRVDVLLPNAACMEGAEKTEGMTGYDAALPTTMALLASEMFSSDDDVSLDLLEKLSDSLHAKMEANSRASVPVETDDEPLLN